MGKFTWLTWDDWFPRSVEHFRWFLVGRWFFGWFGVAVVSQVWSLTQLYSIDFSKSRMGVSKCVFNKHTIEVRVSCFCAVHLTVSLYLCTSWRNVKSELRALKWRFSSSESPSRVRDGDKGVAGRNGREKCFTVKGSLICPPGKSMIFHKEETEKIEVVARPKVGGGGWSGLLAAVGFLLDIGAVRHE